MGHHETAWGLFPFEQIDPQGSLRRWYVPRPAYTHAEVGLRIGNALVTQHSATPEQIRLALVEQQDMRSRKLGDMLVVRQIISAEELAQAIEQPSTTRRWPQTTPCRCTTQPGHCRRIRTRGAEARDEGLP